MYTHISLYVNVKYVVMFFFLIFLFGFKQLQHIFYLNMISVCKYSVSFDIWDAPFGLYVYMSTYHGYLEVLPYIFYFIL